MQPRNFQQHFSHPKQCCFEHFCAGTPLLRRVASISHRWWSWPIAWCRWSLLIAWCMCLASVQLLLQHSPLLAGIDFGAFGRKESSKLSKRDEKDMTLPGTLPFLIFQLDRCCPVLSTNLSSHAANLVSSSLVMLANFSSPVDDNFSCYNCPCQERNDFTWLGNLPGLSSKLESRRPKKPAVSQPEKLRIQKANLGFRNQLGLQQTGP